MSIVRPPAVAGQFYPEEPHVLRDTVEQYLTAIAEHDIPSLSVIGGVVPHAGYMYSGSTAAYVYRSLAGSSAECVVLVGPSHRDYFEPVSVFNGDAYETPLGVVSVHTALARKIAERSEAILLSDLGHRMEHALEVQLPFLQVVLPHATIVPIVMGSQDREYCTDLAGALAEALNGEPAIILASSDLSHFHPYDVARRIDAASAARVDAFDAEGFLRGLETQHIEACGGGPVATVMLASASLGADEARVLHSCNSGDISGDRSSVVGYMAAVFGKGTA